MSTIDAALAAAVKAYDAEASGYPVHEASLMAAIAKYLAVAYHVQRGHVVVPIEPTKAMITKGGAAWEACPPFGDTGDINERTPADDAADIYRAMIADARCVSDPPHQGEMVTLALIRARSDGALAATEQPDQEDPRDWTHIANITFPLPPEPTIPEISATVDAP